MRDQILFVGIPYVAGVVALLGIAWRGAARLQGSRRLSGHRRLPGAWARRVGLTGILAGHAAGLALPGALVEWTRHPVRLLILEGVSLAFAGIALVGVLLGVLFGVRRARRAARTSDVVCFTLLATTLLSGIGVALLHRWSSTWYAATLVPYLHSLAVLEPRLDLAIPMPFLVRFHVLAGFALLAAAPYYGMGRRRAEDPEAPATESVGAPGDPRAALS